MIVPAKIEIDIPEGQQLARVSTGGGAGSHDVPDDSVGWAIVGQVEMPDGLYKELWRG